MKFSFKFRKALVIITQDLGRNTQRNHRVKVIRQLSCDGFIVRPSNPTSCTMLLSVCLLWTDNTTSDFLTRAHYNLSAEDNCIEQNEFILINCRSSMIHTYTYIIGHYSSVRITTQFLTPLTLCALIIRMRGGTYSLNSIPNDRFFRSFSCKFYLLSEFLPEICLVEIFEEIFSYFRFNV